MRASILAGVLLIVIGALVLAFPTISYTDREQVADIGPIEIEAETEDSVSIPGIVGGIVIAAGVGLLVVRR